MTSKAIIRIAVFFSAIVWVMLLFTDLSLVFSNYNQLKAGLSTQWPTFLLNLFILLVFVYYKFRIERIDNINFVDLLWRVFVTGFITGVASVAMRIFQFIVSGTPFADNLLYLDFLYQFNLGLFLAFLISTFLVWKRLILYQKSKFLMRTWRVFESALLISLVYNVLPFAWLDGLFNYLLIGLFLLGLFLSGNMKWVAYLNFKQKWKGILLIALALFYLGYFFYTISQLASKINGLNQVLYADYRENVFIVAILGFIFIYAVFSLLVILFNLPTSSVFEQKLEEVVNFQRLSQSIQTEQNEGRVYEILLETSVSTVFADAAWLEIEDATGERRLYTYRITEKEVREIIAYLETNKVKGVLEESTEKTRHLGRKMAQIKGSQFRSILAYPISIRQQQIGRVALLKEVSDGFNKDMARIISTFANQAGISIENFRLLAQALENERYKEQLKIAKTVQKALLPELLVKDPDFDIVAYSQAADEVGGDYYDSYRVGEKRIALIIGDVSGKGTSAAFQMSQMKGIFSSLCQLDVPTEEFLFRANNALSICLAKKTFITASYFLIDTEKRVVEFSRAGHCPTLFYEAKSQKAAYFKNKGMGMGIIRNETFKNYIASHSFKYDQNDVLVLYTDGITEAKNPKGEEFGYDRLLQAVETWAPHSPEIIQEKLMSQLYDFTETEVIDDDYTVLIVKFK